MTILRSSGEKITIIILSINSDVFLTIFPSFFMDFLCCLFIEISTFVSIIFFSAETFIVAVSSPNFNNSLSFEVRKDFPIEEREIASMRFVFP